jgi:thiol:disulfide interchange protein DsbD
MNQIHFLQQVTISTYKIIRILLLVTLFTVVSSQANEGKASLHVTTFKENPSQAVNYLVVNFQNDPGWHTYWIFPGDAGTPTTFKFFLTEDGTEKEIKIPLLEYPSPNRYIEEGNLWAYGHEGNYSYFFELDRSLQKRLENKSLRIDVNWLACKQICIPGKRSINGSLTKSGFKNIVAPVHQVSKEKLLKDYEELPITSSFPENLELSLALNPEKEDRLVIFYQLEGGLKEFTPIASKSNLLTPYPVSPFSFKHEKLFKDDKGDLYGIMQVEWDGSYQDPEIPFPKNGEFKQDYNFKFIFTNPFNKKRKVISKKFNSFQLESYKELKNFYKTLTPLMKETEGKIEPATDISAEDNFDSTPGQGKGLLYYLLFAFIGGLILNIMPCVLPVISIKLFGLIKHRDSTRKKILKHNLTYSAGVIFSFLVLGLTIVILKSTGEVIGWGFQLQSPLFVLLMLIALFIFTLNLFGLFEFTTPGGSFLGGVKLQKGFLGDFLSGVLATILSTPCSAPFLGVALTFAFMSGTLTILLVFTVLGIGLAFPFILTGFFPKLVFFLPRPGHWMDDLKKFLGLSLILTTVWLVDVFISLTNSFFLLQLNLIMTFTFFAFYFRKFISKRFIYNVMIFSLPILVTFNLVQDTLDLMYNSEESIQEIYQTDKDHMPRVTTIKKFGLEFEKWSPEAMERLKDKKEIVFIDFTADWCFTCKINEKVVISTDGFKELVKEKNMKLLLGDWTKRDPVIGKWLKSKGIVGVPAYFIQQKDGTLTALGEKISLQEIKDNIQ